jgi:hypothetical protein
MRRTDVGKQARSARGQWLGAWDGENKRAIDQLSEVVLTSPVRCRRCYLPAFSGCKLQSGENILLLRKELNITVKATGALARVHS